MPVVPPNWRWLLLGGIAPTEAVLSISSASLVADFYRPLGCSVLIFNLWFVVFLWVFVDLLCSYLFFLALLDLLVWFDVCFWSVLMFYHAVLELLLDMHSTRRCSKSIPVSRSSGHDKV